VPVIALMKGALPRVYYIIAYVIFPPKNTYIVLSEHYVTIQEKCYYYQKKKCRMVFFTFG